MKFEEKHFNTGIQSIKRGNPEESLKTGYPVDVIVTEANIQLKKFLKIKNEEIDNYRYFLREIYDYCDEIRTKNTKDINKLFIITCIALNIEFDDESRFK